MAQVSVKEFKNALSTAVNTDPKGIVGVVSRIGISKAAIEQWITGDVSPHADVQRRCILRLESTDPCKKKGQ